MVVSVFFRIYSRLGTTEIMAPKGVDEKRSDLGLEIVQPESQTLGVSGSKGFRRSPWHLQNLVSLNPYNNATLILDPTPKPSKKKITSKP